MDPSRKIDIDAIEHAPRVYSISSFGVLDWQSLSYYDSNSLDETIFNQDINGDGKARKGSPAEDSVSKNVDPQTEQALSGLSTTELISVGDTPAYGGGAAGGSIDLSIIQEVSGSVIASAAKDSGFESSTLAPATGVMDFSVTITDPNDYGRVWNDSFLKKYTTALLKKQWGQNLIKFQGVKLPGGVELDGRAIYEDGMKDLEIIREMMSNTYELPPLDMIG